MARSDWTARQEILDLVHESVVVRDLDQTITFWNAAAEELYGWTRDEAIGRNSDELMQCVHAAPLAEREATLLATGRWQGELIRRNSSGEAILVEVTWKVRRDEAGVAIEVIETGRDITEKRKIEEASRLGFEALERSETRFRNLFNYMPISLWQSDTRELSRTLAALRADGVTDLAAYIDSHPGFLDELLQLVPVEQVNAETVRMFGGTGPGDFVGPVSRFLQDSPETVTRLFAARFAGAESYAEETKVRTLDGRTIEVFLTSAFPKALAELGIALVGVLDIGDRLQAERLLQQARADFAHAARVATLGELTASIAHEVNQPLAAIAANGEASLRWLDRAEPNVEEARELAAKVVADARRAAEVIAHIRTMATRQSSGQERLSINDVVADTLGFLQRDLQAKDVRLEFVASPDLPPVEADGTQIQQVLVNLVVNAEQAMIQHEVADRRLTIRTLPAVDAICVEVEDSGPGIPADRATRLFDSFFTTKAEGLGIGLAICRSIIEAHGGRIAAVDTGRGARFAFTLPAADVITATPPPTHTNV